jgi:hypothetical protein
MDGPLICPYQRPSSASRRSSQSLRLGKLRFVIQEDIARRLSIPYMTNDASLGGDLNHGGEVWPRAIRGRPLRKVPASRRARKHTPVERRERYKEQVEVAGCTPSGRRGAAEPRGLSLRGRFCLEADPPTLLCGRVNWVRLSGDTEVDMAEQTVTCEAGRCKNTRISYLYRDGSNYKRGKEVVVAGSLTYEQVAPYLDEHRYFIASEVGLPDPQLDWKEEGYEFPSEDDHVYCELYDDYLQPTDDAATLEVTAAELFARFQRTNGKWDVAAAIERLGLVRSL